MYRIEFTDWHASRVNARKAMITFVTEFIQIDWILFHIDCMHISADGIVVGMMKAAIADAL